MPLPELEKDIQALLQSAADRGVQVSRLIAPSSVVTAEWVRLKCQFGCSGYGQSLTCPPYSPTPDVTRRTLDEYSQIILLHLPDEHRRLREATIELEHEAFWLGYHKALAMTTGPCHLCDPCSLRHPCNNPDQARPSMESCGIDVYQTARNAGFHIETLKSRDCTANYFSLLLVR